MNCETCDGTGRLTDRNAAFPGDHVTFQCDECQGSGVEPGENQQQERGVTMQTVIEQSNAQTVLSFPVQDFDIDALRPQVMALTKPDLTDTKAIKLVQETRMRCVKMRTAIESTREKFKAPWLAGGRAVDDTANQLKLSLKPLEEHCNNIQKELDAERERIHEEKIEAVFVKRIAAVNAAGIQEVHGIRSMADSEFTAWFNKAIERKREEEERARKAAEQEEANRIERERLEAMRKQQELLQRRMRQLAAVRYFPSEEEVDRMNDTQFSDALKAATDIFEEQKAADKKRQEELDRIAEENAERIRQETVQKAREEAAEQSRKDTEARLKRQAEVAEQERIAEEARKAKEAELAPAKDKLNTLCVAVMAISLPTINSDVDAKVHAARLAFIRAIGRIANELE